MKIIITEEQYKLLTEVRMTEENLFRFLYSLWDKQKKNGEEPYLADIIYDVTDISRGSIQDEKEILPIWFHYLGGFDKIFDEVKKEIEGQELTIESSDHNLTMNVIVEDVTHIDDTYTVEVFLTLVDGMVDGYDSDDDGNQSMRRMSLRDQYAQLEYDVDDFLYFLKEKAHDYLNNRFGKYGITFYIDIDF
jgi:hypothetical protein